MARMMIDEQITMPCYDTPKALPIVYAGLEDSTYIQEVLTGITTTAHHGILPLASLLLIEAQIWRVS